MYDLGKSSLNPFYRFSDIQVDFGDIVYTVTESDGVATVFLSKTGENEIPVTVSVVTETRDDTAVGESIVGGGRGET